MKKRITIIDVAKTAGVSPSTVSRVLNGRSGNVPISDTTRKLVEATATELGYEASVFASALRTDRTQVLGAVIRDIRDPFLSLLLQEIQEVAYQAKQEVLIGHARYDINRAGRFFRLMRGRLFDGLILLGDMPGDDGIIHELSQHPVPFVTIARGTKATTPSVNVDDTVGTQLALEYLVELGHSSIGCISSMTVAGLGERVDHYKTFVADRKLPWYPQYVQTGNMTQIDIYNALQTMFTAPEPPTAIFCALDRVALKVIDVCRRMDLRVPEDVSIIGFDDIDDAAFSYPTLTTIRQPVDVMAQKAIDILMACIETSASADSDLRQQRHILEPTLVIRDSCRRRENE